MRGLPLHGRPMPGGIDVAMRRPIADAARKRTRPGAARPRRLPSIIAAESPVKRQRRFVPTGRSTLAPWAVAATSAPRACGPLRRRPAALTRACAGACARSRDGAGAGAASDAVARAPACPSRRRSPACLRVRRDARPASATAAPRPPPTPADRRSASAQVEDAHRHHPEGGHDLQRRAADRQEDEDAREDPDHAHPAGEQADAHRVDASPRSCPPSGPAPRAGPGTGCRR